MQVCVCVYIYIYIYTHTRVWSIICIYIYRHMGLPGGTNNKEHTCQCRRHKRCSFDPWSRTIPWRRAQQPTPVFLTGESHGQRNLVDCSTKSCKELNSTEDTWNLHVKIHTHVCVCVYVCVCVCVCVYMVIVVQ